MSFHLLLPINVRAHHCKPIRPLLWPWRKTRERKTRERACSDAKVVFRVIGQPQIPNGRRVHVESMWMRKDSVRTFFRHVHRIDSCVNWWGKQMKTVRTYMPYMPRTLHRLTLDTSTSTHCWHHPSVVNANPTKKTSLSVPNVHRTVWKPGKMCRKLLKMVSILKWSSFGFFGVLPF